MLQRLLMTGFAVLGTSMSFGMSLVGAVSLAKPAMVPISPTNELKVYELYLNAPGGASADDGREYIEIKNTSASTMAIEDVWLLYIDCETSERGEVDVALRLGDDGSGGIGGSGARNLAPGEVLVIRDAVGSGLPPGSPATINPNGGTVITINFENHAGWFASEPRLKNSGGAFILCTANTASPGDQLDTTPNNGVLDSIPWTNTLDCVDTRQSGTGGASVHYSSSIPQPHNGGSYDKIQCIQQTSWTPDGFSRLETGGSYTAGLIYDLVANPGTPPPTFTFPSSEYEFATIAAGSGTPTTVSGAPGATPGLSGQFSVKNGAMGATTWTH